VHECDRQDRQIGNATITAGISMITLKQQSKLIHNTVLLSYSSFKLHECSNKLSSAQFSNKEGNDGKRGNGKRKTGLDNVGLNLQRRKKQDHRLCHVV